VSCRRCFLHDSHEGRRMPRRFSEPMPLRSSGWSGGSNTGTEEQTARVSVSRDVPKLTPPPVANRVMVAARCEGTNRPLSCRSKAEI
jgi:hypothetical protein